MMSSILVALLLLVVFGGVAFLLWWFQGFWGCLVAFVNTLFAASLASVSYGPVVGMLESRMPTYGYLLHFVVLWAIFCVAMAIATELSRLVTRTAVPFDPLVERVGAPIAAVLTGWVAMAFTAASLHTAPVPRDAVGSGMFLGVSPDRGWLAWSIGAATKPPFGGDGGWFSGNRGTVDGATAWYAARRGQLEKEPGLRAAPPADPAPAAAQMPVDALPAAPADGAPAAGPDAPPGAIPAAPQAAPQAAPPAP
jgi:hypothetical protein